MKKTLVALSLVVASQSLLAYTGDNDPKYIVPNGTHKLKNMPLNAELSADKTPWASSFFPHVYGGIAFRWNNFYKGVPSFATLHYQVDDINAEIEELKTHLFDADLSSNQVNDMISKIQSLESDKLSVNNEKAKDYKRYFFDIKRPDSLADIRAMSQEERDQLSAAEKYDIYIALMTGKKLNMRLTKDVLDLTGPYKAYWEGICNGWSSAAIEFKEPQPISYAANGIKINFNSSDLKALLSYYHASITRNWRTAKKNMTSRVGERCKDPFPKEAWFIKDGKEYYKEIVNGKTVVKAVSPECQDTNAGAFHIVMTNMLGLQSTGFVAEMVRDKEVWNQPVYKYTSKIKDLSEAYVMKTPGTVKQVEVETELFYANDGGRMFWRHDGSDDEFYAWAEKTNGTSNYRSASKTMKYILDLDRAGNIIGGHWLSYERPDFLWVKRSRGFLGTGFLYGIVGYMDNLKNLVELQE
tara:strand:+ start:129660 stop:131063 length:1404 start_codon:yes stop_codon:yes gene_type:complete